MANTTGGGGGGGVSSSSSSSIFRLLPHTPSMNNIKVLLLLLINVLFHAAYGDVPALFVLGDSTVDVGTNTLLPNCTVRADFPNNGIDFPNSTPTGRFSNGFNLADFIARNMGHKLSPAPFLFLESRKHGLRKGARKGVNFASSGSGLLDVTGSTFGVLPLSEQMKQFVALYYNVSAVNGEAWLQNLLSKSFFCFSTGSNDIFWYFANNYTTPEHEFVGLMLQEFRTAIETLYSLGARKFGIVGVSPVGCCPVKRLLNDTLGCFQPMNHFAKTFNSQLLSLMLDLSSELEDIQYAFGDVYQMTIDSMKYPAFYNFNNVEAACCGHGVLNAEGLCNSTANVCLDHKDHVFWDLYHASEAAAEKEALNLFAGPKEYGIPINFATLLHQTAPQVMVRTD
ncbi:PREDICTED: GDSL esterase/lipase At5g55050-like [Ipomoea nil]|uniref:GDSL esterase/lipase At5g55050-like n=1 Tax=Ipomoea nil TaxID=35883 RepID=UPI000902011B|nr:PREDICTED: GDSL esterase/lipase At5g55050-like [Ipomoea nil]